MSTSLRVVIVEDEVPARRRLARMLARIGDVELVGEAGDADTALHIVATKHPRLVLLDINLPGRDGLWIAGRLADVDVVFTTAYDEHALRAFELAAVDYLLKPFDDARLERTIARVREREAERSWPALVEQLRGAMTSSSTTPPSPSARTRLSARAGSSVYVFDPGQVARISASAKYSVFWHEGREYLLDRSLSDLEAELAPSGFVRVHRSALVNLDRVRALHTDGSGAELELDDGSRVPVSRRSLSTVERALGVKR